MLLAIAVTVILIAVLLHWWSDDSRSEEVDLSGCHVLITGGSSGIGLALASEALRRSCRQLTLVARDEERLAKAKKMLLESHGSHSNIHTISLDITAPYEEIRKCLVEKNNVGIVDVLINCAGSAIVRKVVDATPENFEQMMRINYMGPVNVTKVLLNDMLTPTVAPGPNGESEIVIEPKNRRIAFLSTMAAQVAIYGYSPYAASKIALTHFGNILQQELEDDGPKVTVVYPPDTDTPGLAAENVGKPLVSSIIDGSAGIHTPASVAARAMHFILSGRRSCSFGPVGRAATWCTAGISRIQEDASCPALRPFPTIGMAAVEILLAPLLRAGGLLYAYWMRSVIIKHH